MPASFSAAADNNQVHLAALERRACDNRGVAVSPEEDMPTTTKSDHVHESHPKIVKRLKRAEGHLRRVIEMFVEGRSCLDPKKV
jgi:hypothetical protein